MTKSGPKFFVREATGLTRTLSGSDALIGNLASVGLGYAFTGAFFGVLLYPGVDLPGTVIFGFFPSIVIGLLYYYFTVAMPRTGGDYVWVGRVIHPLIGFVCNFIMSFALWTFVAGDAVWAVSYGLSPMLAAFGKIHANPGLISLASNLNTPTTSFVLAAVLMTLFVLPVFAGTKATFRVLWVLVAVTFFGGLVTIGAFYSTPNSIFIANFDKLSGMEYAKVITTAGLPSGTTLAMTLTGAIYTIGCMSGFNWSAYYTGEVKSVSRSQLLAMIGGLSIVALFYYLLYTAAYYSAGPDFITAIANLSGTGNSYYSAVTAPTLNFLAFFAVPNDFVIIAPSLAFFITTLGSCTVFTFITVRNMFSWAFDRVLPTQFVKLDSRWGSPYVAILAVWLIQLFLVFLYVYTVALSYFIYVSLISFIVFALVSVSGIWFSSRRKDIFEASPSIVRKRIGGVPVLSVLGAIGLAEAIFLTYSTLQPLIIYPPSGPPVVQLLSYASGPLAIAVAVVIYLIAFFYRRGQGIDMRTAFRELPPE